MTITEKTTITFEPVKEYKAMTAWEQANDMSEWQKHESTAAITFIREQTVFIGVEEGAEDE